MRPPGALPEAEDERALLRRMLPPVGRPPSLPAPVAGCAPAPVREPARRCMEGALELSVPLVVEVGEGPTGLSAEARSALEHDPQHPGARFVLGQALAVQERYAEAVPIFEALVAEQPQGQADAELLTELGVALIGTGDLTRARDELQRADPTSYYARVARAEAFLRLGRRAQARQEAQAALILQDRPQARQLLRAAAGTQGAGREKAR